MTIQHQLDRLRDEAPGCDLVAFGDLSSGLILNWAARSACQREVLDLLMQNATASLALLAPVGLPGGVDLADMGTSVIHFTERGAEVFVRLSAASDEVICVACPLDADLERLLGSTIALADQIEGNG